MAVSAILITFTIGTTSLDDVTLADFLDKRSRRLPSDHQSPRSGARAQAEALQAGLGLRDLYRLASLRGIFRAREPKDQLISSHPLRLGARLDPHPKHFV